MKTDMDYLVLGNFLIDKAATRPQASSGSLQPLLPQESRPTLRRFGFTIGIAFFLFGSLLDFRHRAAGRPFQSLAILFLVFAGLAPDLLRFVYRPWMRLARFLGAISSAVLLTVVFFLVVTPIGFLQRFIGKRSLDLRFKTQDATYWERRTARATPADYDKQF